MGKHSESIKELAIALAAAQAEIENPALNATARLSFRDGATRDYQYADLSAIWSAIRKPLTSHGLAVVQWAETDSTLVDNEGRTGLDVVKVRVETMLLHSSGEWLHNSLELVPKDNSPHAIGSIITYGRRYSLAAIVGVCGEKDDDGAAAQNDHQQPPPARRRQPPPARPQQPPVQGQPRGQHTLATAVTKTIGVNGVDITFGRGHCVAEDCQIAVTGRDNLSWVALDGPHPGWCYAHCKKYIGKQEEPVKPTDLEDEELPF